MGERPLLLDDSPCAQYHPFLVPKQFLYYILRFRFGGNVIKHRVLPISVGF
jgi:hypothetical protein